MFHKRMKNKARPCSGSARSASPDKPDTLRRSKAVRGPDRMLCQSFWHIHLHASQRVPLCAIGLAPAGHRVADACASSRVHVLHHDEGMLLQGGHCQVTVIRHLLQEAAIPRPDRVTHLEDPSSKRAHLQNKTKNSVLLNVCSGGMELLPLNLSLSSFGG